MTAFSRRWLIISPLRMQKSSGVSPRPRPKCGPGSVLISQRLEATNALSRKPEGCASSSVTQFTEAFQRQHLGIDMVTMRFSSAASASAFADRSPYALKYRTELIAQYARGAKVSGDHRFFTIRLAIRRGSATISSTSPFRQAQSGNPGGLKATNA